MARQGQTVDGGEAYQAGGNLTVVRGIDAEQMASIMIAMGRQLKVYFDEAESKLEERLASFRSAVLEEFAKPDNADGAKAFSDPDFQFVLNDAQKVFARDGSSEIRDDLVKLLVQRSKYDSKERLAKIINQAIELAGSFSKDECAALAVNFLLFHVKFQTQNQHTLLEQLNSFLSPFYADLSEIQTVYEYIESQRCATINYLTDLDVVDHYHKTYVALFAYGFDFDQLQEIHPGTDVVVYQELITATKDAKRPYRFVDSDPSELAGKLRKLGMPEQYINNATNLHNISNPNKEKFEIILRENIEGFDRVLQVWKDTALSKMALTAVGKAIAHSILAGRAPFHAQLEVWVK